MPAQAASVFIAKKMPHIARPVTPIVFEEEFILGLKKVFEEMTVFNKLLGLTVTSLKPEQVLSLIHI